jgi:hypothetical protein
MSRPLFTAAATLLVAQSAFAAPAIGYAQASGYFKKDSRPTQYQPLNLLDGRETTAWCSPTSDPLSESLTFGFKGVALIDEVRIYTGNGFDQKTFAEFSRARKLSIRGPVGAQTLTISDQRGLQAVSLDQPMQGAQFTVEVLDQYPAADPESPVCITDIIFYSEGKPLNGPWLTQRLKFDKQQAPYLGTWFAGPDGAPNRYLSFFFDGTYRMVFDPYDENVPDRVTTGTFDPSGGWMTLEIPGKGKVAAKMRRETKTNATGSKIRVLGFEGDLPEDFKQSYRDRL